MTEGARVSPIASMARLAAAPWRAFLLIFVVHVGIHGFFLAKVRTDLVRPHTRWEIMAVAMALHERGEFADPYCLPTGPTAHMPPFHPFLIAAIYRLLGPTLAAGYVTWLILIACNGAMFGMLPWLGGRLGLGREAGLVGGLVGAAVPRWPGFVEAPSAIAIGLMMVVFLRRWEGRSATAGGSLALGLAIGLALLVAPSLLPVALGLVAFELFWLRDRSRRWAALTLLGMALACTPWTWRNYRALGGLFFVRSNFGLELRMGNHEGAGANLDLSARGGTERHPRTSEEEARKVQKVGELPYMRAAGREAKTWIRSHPGEFLRLTGLRVFQFWFGPLDDRLLALWTSVLTVLAAVGVWKVLPLLSVPRRAAILIPLVAFPLVYYLVGYEWRYRQPMDGITLLLATRGAAALLGIRTAGEGPRGS